MPGPKHRRRDHLRLVAISLVALLLPPVPWALAQRPADPSPARSSHDYELRRRDAVSVAVEVEARGFEWPALPESADTVFLELSVTARRGRREPSIEILAADTEQRQYFEPGAQGRRYLNLSRLASTGLAAGERVALLGHRLTWLPQTTGLTAFINPSLNDRRVLVLAPHPDDAEIAAFGLYSTTEADVVTVTAGDAGGFNYRALYPDKGTHYRMKGLVRAWDSVTVPLLGGVPPGRARNLGYYDATLRRLYEVHPQPLSPALAKLDHEAHYRQVNLAASLRDRPLKPTWEGLVADLLWELGEVEPNVVVAPHPFLDSHHDHQFTTVALIEALEKWQGEDWELYLYTNHAVQAEAHPLGPSSGLHSLPPWFGEGLVFSRLYSHPLTPDRVRLKILALEAMHDLRSFEVAELTGDPTLAVGRQAGERRGRRRRGHERLTYSYFRRAPRPNELFFVLTREDARALHGEFLRQHSAAPSGGARP